MVFKKGPRLSTIEEVDSTLSTPAQERRFGTSNNGYEGNHDSPSTHPAVFIINHSPVHPPVGGDEVDQTYTQPPQNMTQGDEINLKKSGECWGGRHTLTVLASLCLAIQYSTRVNLSLAIVAMVGTTSHNDTNNTLYDTCPTLNDTDNNDRDVQGEFNWGAQTQGLVLGAFYWGYATTNFVGGRAAEHIGGRLVLGVSVALSSLLTLLNPLCASLSKELFIAIRVLIGVSQGVTYPALAAIMAAWIPPKERAKLGSIVYSGSQAGTVVTLVVSGWLCDSEFLGGWPSVFYVFGALGFVWCVLWFLLVHDSPETHPTITPAELNHIQSSQDLRAQSKIKNIPWKAIFTAPPMWAGMVMCLGTSFGFFTILTELPTYLSNIQHFDINSNGLLSALPYLIQWGFSIVWGAIMDVLTRTRVLSLTSVRRVSTGVGCYVFSGALIAVGFVNCNPTLAVVAMCVALGFNGAMYSGQYMLEIDIAPNLAGTLVGINNTLSAIAGFIAPVFTGAITNNSETLSSWRIVFLVAAGLSIFTTTFYMVFMSVDVQPWNDPTTDNKDNTTTADNSDNRGIQTVIIPHPLPLTLPRLKL